MATPTYDLLDSVVLSSASTSITFSSIDTSTYADLVLTIRGQGGNGDFYPRIRYNGNSSNNYYYIAYWGTGSSAYTSNGQETGWQLGNNQYFSTSYPNSVVAHIMGADTTSDPRPTLLSRIGTGRSGTEFLHGVAGINGPITQIQLYSTNGNSLAAGSEINLYGIVK